MMLTLLLALVALPALAASPVVAEAPSQAMLEAHRADVEACYARALLKAPTAAGTLRYRIRMGAGGVVASVVVEQTFSAELATCVQDLFTRHLFAAAAGSEFTQTLTLTPEDVSVAELVLAAATVVPAGGPTPGEVARRAGVPLINEDTRYAAIEQAVRATAPTWRTCAAVPAGGQPVGYLQFRVGTDGRVEWAAYVPADVHASGVGGCVEAHFREARLGVGAGEYAWIER